MISGEHILVEENKVKGFLGFLGGLITGGSIGAFARGVGTAGLVVGAVVFFIHRSFDFASEITPTDWIGERAYLNAELENRMIEASLEQERMRLEFDANEAHRKARDLQDTLEAARTYRDKFRIERDEFEARVNKLKEENNRLFHLLRSE